MKKIIIYCCFILTLNEGLLMAQGSEEPVKSNLIPPSPTASALGKYGEIPVSMYTGTPNVSIPLFSLQSGGVAIPIGLSYHASGIKVDDIASWVGLGWSLNAGGVITRNIVGYPDEHGTYSYWNSGGDELDTYLSGSMTTSQVFEFKDNVARGLYDTEPDIFYYNFLGRSGKIVFDKDKDPAIIPHANLLVEGSVNTGFSITDEGGTKYSFNAIENSEVTPWIINSISNTGNTAWYLTQIKATSGKTINFEYQTEQIYYELRAGESMRYLTFEDAGCSMCPRSTVSQVSGSDYHSFSQRLSKITTDNDSIVFTQGVADTYGIHELSSIDIFTRDNLSTPRKSFVFDYSDFGSNRRKLNSVQQFAGAKSLPAHEFSYNIPAVVPPRLSYDQDHWGYYNDNPEETFIPETVIGINSYSGAVREPDPERTKSFILTDITYPTGGQTHFEFEPHDYGYVTVGELNYIKYVEQYETAFAGGASGFQETPLYIDYTQSVKITYSVLYYSGAEVDLSVALLNVNNIELFSAEMWELSDPGGLQTYETTITLDVGSYTLQALSDVPDGEYCRITLSYKDEYEENGEVVIFKNKTGGGVRIKSISHKVDAISEAFSKSYEYTMSVDQTRSSGSILSEPSYSNYSFENQYIVHCESTGMLIPYWVRCKYFILTASNKSTLGSTRGAALGYREVTEYENLNKSGGKTIYEYLSPYDYPDYISTHPSAHSSYDYKRGHLKKSTSYKDYNGSYSPTTSTAYSYTIEPVHNRTVVNGIAITYELLDDADTPSSSTFYDSPYTVTSEWQYLSSTINTMYTDNGDILSTTQYVYDNPTHAQLSEKITDNSKSQSIKTSYTYPLDFSTSTDVSIVKRIAKHIDNQVIEQIVSVDDKVTTASATNYQYDDVNDIITPHEYYGLETQLPIPLFTGVTTGSDFDSYEKKIIYSKLDNFANPLEFYNEDNIYTAIIWGYNQSLPIAKIVNATYSQIESALGGAGFLLIDNGNNLDESQITLIRGNPALERAQIFTYTYDVLFGMTSQTDPNGISTYYNYDDFGRLITVKDDDNNLIKHIEYHYYNEN